MTSPSDVPPSNCSIEASADAEQLALIFAQRLDQRGHVGACFLVHRRKLLMSLFGQAERPFAGVDAAFAADKAVAFEPRDHAAEIAGVEAQLGGDGLGQNRFALGDFIDYPSFGEGKRAMLIARFEQTRGTREKAVEAAQLDDGGVDGRGHSANDWSDS